MKLSASWLMLSRFWMRSVCRLRPPNSPSESNSCGAIFDVAENRARLTTLEKKLSEPGFWDNPEAAQRVLQERKQADDRIQADSKLERWLGDLETYLTLAAEEADEVKSVGHSMTLKRDITDRSEILRYLLQLSEMIGRRARRYQRQLHRGRDDLLDPGRRLGRRHPGSPAGRPGPAASADRLHLGSRADVFRRQRLPGRAR